MSYWQILSAKSRHPDPEAIRGGLPVVTEDMVKAAMFGLDDPAFFMGMVVFLDHRESLPLVEGFLRDYALAFARRNAWAGRDEDGSALPLPPETLQRLDAAVSLGLYEAVSARSQHETYAHETKIEPHVRTVRCPECKGRGLVAGPSTCDELKAELRREAQDLLSSRHRGRRAALASVREDLRQAHRPSEVGCPTCKSRGRYLLTDRARAVKLHVSDRTWRRTWRDRYQTIVAEAQRWERRAVSHVRRRLGLGDC